MHTIPILFLLLIFTPFRPTTASFFHTNWFENPHICAQTQKLPNRKKNPKLSLLDTNNVLKFLAPKVSVPKNKMTNRFLIRAKTRSDFKDYFKMIREIDINHMQYFKYMLPLKRSFEVFTCKNLYSNQFKEDRLYLEVKCGLGPFVINRKRRDGGKYTESQLFHYLLSDLKRLSNFLKFYMIMLKEGFFFAKETLEMGDFVKPKCSSLLGFKDLTLVQAIKASNYESQVRAEILKIEKFVSRFWKEIELFVLENMRKDILARNQDSERFYGSLYSPGAKFDETIIRIFLKRLKNIDLNQSMCKSISKSSVLVQRVSMGIQGIIFYASAYPFKIDVSDIITGLIYPKRPKRTGLHNILHTRATGKRVKSKSHKREKKIYRVLKSTRKPIRNLSIERLRQPVNKSFFQNYVQIKMRQRTKKRKRRKSVSKVAGFRCEAIVLNSLKLSIRRFQSFSQKEDFLKFHSRPTSKMQKFEVKSQRIQQVFHKLKNFKIVNELIRLLDF